MNISYNLVKIIFSYLKEPKLLNLIRHNKKFQKICNKTIKDYQLSFLSKFIDIFTYSFVYHDNFFFDYGQFRVFLYDVDEQLIRILSFKEPIYINQKYDILNEIYKNEINLYNSLLEAFNITSLIEYLFSQNKIKIQLFKETKTERINKKIKYKRGRYRGRRGSRGNRGNRIANGDRDLGCESEDEDEEEYEEEEDVKEIYKIIYIYNKLYIYSEEFDTIKEVLNGIKKYNNINGILEFIKYSNNYEKSFLCELYNLKNPFLRENILNLEDLNLISYKIEQITINYKLYYSHKEYEEVEVGEPQIKQILNLILDKFKNYSFTILKKLKLKIIFYSDVDEYAICSPGYQLSYILKFNFENINEINSENYLKFLISLKINYGPDNQILKKKNFSEKFPFKIFIDKFIEFTNNYSSSKNILNLYLTPIQLKDYELSKNFKKFSIDLRIFSCEQNAELINYLYTINFKNNTLRILLNNRDEIFTTNNYEIFNIYSNIYNGKFSSITVLDYPSSNIFERYERKKKGKEKRFKIKIIEDKNCENRQIYFPYLSYRRFLNNDCIKINSYKNLEIINLYIPDFSFVESDLFSNNKEKNIKLNNIKIIVLNINEPNFSLISKNLENFFEKFDKENKLKEIEIYSEKHVDNIKNFIKDYFLRNKNKNPLYFKFIKIDSYPPKGYNFAPNSVLYNFYKYSEDEIVEFLYNKKEYIIKCDIEDKMKDICKKFASKINEDFNDLSFTYYEEKINYDLSFVEQFKCHSVISIDVKKITYIEDIHILYD